MKQVLQDFYDFFNQRVNQRAGYKLHPIATDSNGNTGFSWSDDYYYHEFDIIRDTDNNDIAVRWIFSYDGDSHRGDDPTYFTKYKVLTLDANADLNLL